MTEPNIEAEQLRAYLVKLAAGKVERGIIQEPRAYYDLIELNRLGEVTAGHPEVFKNGEDFPITITTMAMAVNLLDHADDPTEDDERNIARIGVQLTWHDQYYMNSQFIPAPAWQNVLTATNAPSAFSSSSWKFDIPFVLSARDTMQVDCSLIVESAVPLRLTVSFTGIGLLSGRPYLLSSFADLLEAVETTLPTTLLRNDGSEPIIVTDMIASMSSPEDLEDPTGDIRNILLNVRQVGNGTGASWCQGPDNQPGPELMPGTLFGITTGRAVVHRFPGDGLRWEPGEGLDVFAQALRATAQAPNDSILQIALLGFITIS